MYVTQEIKHFFKTTISIDQTFSYVFDSRADNLAVSSNLQDHKHSSEHVMLIELFDIDGIHVVVIHKTVTGACYRDLLNIPMGHIISGYYMLK